MLVVGSVLAGLVVVGVAWYFLGGSNVFKPSSDDISGPPRELTNGELAAIGATSLVSGVTEETSDKEIANTEAQLRGNLSRVNSPEEKEAYLLALVDMYSMVEKSEKLLEYTLALDANNPTNMSAGWVGLAYERQQRWADAAKYYGLAAERSQKSENPSSDTPYNRYMMDKKRVEEKL